MKEILSITAVARELLSKNMLDEAEALSEVAERLAQISVTRNVPVSIRSNRARQVANELRTFKKPIYLGTVQVGGRAIGNAIAIHGDSQGYVHTGDSNFGNIHPKNEPDKWRSWLAYKNLPLNTQPINCFGKQSGSAVNYGGEIEISSSSDGKGEPELKLTGK